MVFFCSGFSVMLFYTLMDLQVSQYVVSKAVLLFRFLRVTCCSVLCNWSSAIPSPEKTVAHFGSFVLCTRHDMANGI